MREKMDVRSSGKPSLLSKFSERFSVEPGKMLETLKLTAFKQRDGSAPTNEQMIALLAVADNYGLNPFTREIYALPDKQNGIVPVVGVDGWSRIINGHPEFDGMEFRYSDALVTPPGASAPCHEWVECVMYRKDRSRPIVVREYLDEVYRAPFKEGMKGPWQTHIKRFLRHKAMIQCARLAFGFVGIFDEDEAGRIAEQSERDMGPAQVVREQKKALPACPEEQIDKYAAIIESGQRPAEQIISMLQTRYELTPGQISSLLEISPPIEGDRT